MDNYELQKKQPSVKYKTKAADYYRRNIDNLISGADLEEIPSYEIGIQIIQEDKRKFESYGAFGSDDLIKETRPKERTFEDRLNGIKSFFRNPFSNDKPISEEDKKQSRFEDFKRNFKSFGKGISKGLSTIGVY